MQYKKIGANGIKVSEVCLGTHPISGDAWGKINDEESIRTIHAALDIGMNFIDAAHAYGLGHAEEVLGEVLKDRRSETILCNKVGNCWDDDGNRYPDSSYDTIMRMAEQGLKRMQTDYFDIYLLHFPDPKVHIEESMKAMSKLLEEKVIRAVGVSRFDIERLKEAQKYIKIDMAQYPVNMLSDSFVTLPGFDEEHEIKPTLKYCQEQNIPVMGYGGIARGLLTGKFSGNESFPEGDARKNAAVFNGQKFKEVVGAVEKLRPIAKKYDKTLAQLAINWNLCQPGVITVPVGARNPDQIKDNAGGSGWQLELQDLKEIDNIVKEWRI